MFLEQTVCATVAVASPTPSHSPFHSMLHCRSPSASVPAPRPSSPAVSEISVGSPSPPPLASDHLRSSTTFQPVQIKQPSIVPTPRQARKSSVERVKSFSIADILGKRDGPSNSPHSPPLTNSTNSKTPSMAVPLPQPPPLHANSLPTATLLPTTLLSERLQPPAPIAVPPPSQLLLDLPPALPKVMLPTWEDIRGAAIPLRPFFPPALLHYEHRLAWDYQRQLQEHFQAQAQLLRQMSMDPTIIPSEDGSERSRSRSSSTGGSECCSPELQVGSKDVGARAENMEDGETTGKQKSSSNEASEGGSKSKVTGDTPLDALFQLSTKNFDEEQDPATLSIFATRPNPKKKRKSRTAFTNHQIFELEKRFLYQKYLSPADRDEIAASLGLSNAQVITWFQNRRAKLKRDMEELKKDVESVKQLSAHKSFLENVNDLSILKTRPVSRQHPAPPPPPPPPPTAAAVPAPQQSSTTAPTATSPVTAITQPVPPPILHCITLNPADAIRLQPAHSNNSSPRAESNASQPRHQLNSSRG